MSCFRSSKGLLLAAECPLREEKDYMHPAGPVAG